MKGVNKLATINDIAKKSGFSTATVSYVLSGRGTEHRISEKTQDKILKIARELEYERTPVLSPDRPTIGIYWMHKHLEMTMPSIINGINAAISSEITPVDVLIRPFEQGLISKQETLWTSGYCSASIIIAATQTDLDYLRDNPVPAPCVLFNRELPNYSSVSVDHEIAGRLAAQHAIRCGGNDLALVLNPSALFGLNYRGKAILETCLENDIDMRNNLFYSENLIDEGYELGWEMIRNNQLRKVIICVYDMVGMGIMSALNEAGIEVGKEVKIISTSSGLSRLFARTSPPMTVVDLRTEEVSEKALKMAIGLATRQLTGLQKIEIRPSIIYRQSCPMGDVPINDLV